MSLSHSPNIVTKGLEFYFDMANTKKSWKGKPITNMAAGRISTGNGNVPTTTVTAIKPDGLLGDVQEHSCEFIVDSNRTISGGSFTVTEDVTYTLSFYVINIDCSGFNGNLYSPTLGAALGGITYPPVYTDKWARVEQVFTVPNNALGTITLSPQLFRDGGNGRFRLTDIQLEETAFASPYVDGTRSDTEAIVDMTGKHVLTPNNLTYASNGTFSFNGSYIGIPDIPEITLADCTFNFIFKLDTITGDRDLFNKGTHGTNQPCIIWFDATVATPDSGAGNVNAISVMATDGTTQHWVATDSNAIAAGIYYCLDVVLKPSTDQILIYLNGDLVKSNTKTWNGVADTVVNSRIGSAGNSVNYVDGDIAVTKIYSKALTAKEVNQNFNALKERFGI